jgi:glycosyltransferase involved in cell wall biosynthesis
MQDIHNAPLVSVIVPNYNHAPFLPERLNSILGQTFQDFELIILDDASTDNSIQVIKEHLSDYPYRLITNSLNSGSPCSQWLKGIELARGSYIWIAESDDSCSPKFLAELVELIHGGTCLAYCRTLGINEDGRTDGGYYYWPDEIHPLQWNKSFVLSAREFCRKYMLAANCIPNASAVVFQRQAAMACQKIATLLQDKLFTGDWIFWIQLMASANGLVAYNAERLCWFRYHSLTTRSASKSTSVDRRRIKEYCQAVSWIHAQRLSSGRLPWLSHILRVDWEWMLVEYLWRLKPTAWQRLTGNGLTGPLAWSLPLRLLRSPQLRGLFFPSATAALTRYKMWHESSISNMKRHLMNILR